MRESEREKEIEIERNERRVREMKITHGKGNDQSGCILYNLGADALA